ncbi:MAG: DUF4157 domain-containing protein, partial [Acidimicrobiales bacterium]
LGEVAALGAIPPPSTGSSPPATDGPAAPPDLPLPRSVQRATGPRRPIGLGRPLPAVPLVADPAGTAQRAPAGPPPADAPLVGTAPLMPTPPLAAVQRAVPTDGSGDEAPARGDHHDHGPHDHTETPALDLAAGAAPEANQATAPLVGAVPLEPVTGGGATAEAGAPDSSPAEPGPPATRPDLALVQRAPGSPTAPTSVAATAGSTSSAATIAPSVAQRPPLVVAPLLGGRPFSTQVQRAADGVGSAPAGLVDRTGPEALSPDPGRTYQPLAGIGMWNGAPPPDLPGPAIEAPPGQVAAAVQRATGADVSNVRIRRDTGVTAQRLSARAFTHEGEVHIPAAVGSLASGEGASLAAHELVHAGQQSVLGSSRPHEHTAEGQALEAQARSAEHASLAGLELPRMPLVPPPAPSVQRAASDGGSSSPFSPQQLSTLLSLADRPGADDVSVQRWVSASPSTLTEAPSSAPAPDPAPASGQPQTPQELDELAVKLFPTLRNLFRSELLGFRRRSGSSSDRPLS